MGKRDTVKRIDLTNGGGYAGASIIVGGGGGGGGGGGTGGVLADWQIPQAFLHSGVRPMTGNLQMGAFNIITGGLVDGRDVALDGDRLDILRSRHVIGGAGLLDTGKTLGEESPTLSINLGSTPSGLIFNGDALNVDDNLAGAGLGIANKVMYVKTTEGVELSGDNVRVDEDYQFEWANRHEWGNNQIVIHPGLKTVRINWDSVDPDDGSYNAGLRVKAGAPADTTLYLKQIPSQTGQIFRAEDVGGDALIILTNAGDLESGKPGFVSGRTGWQIAHDGTAEFNNVWVRGGFHASLFTADELSASSGTILVATATKVGDPVLPTDNVIPSLNSSFNLVLEGSETSGNSYFLNNYIIRIKTMMGAVGSSLTITDLFVEVVGTPTKITGTNNYNTPCEVRQVFPPNATGKVIPPGTAAVKWGQTGGAAGKFTGNIIITADLNLAPYIDIATIASDKPAGDSWSTPPAEIPRVRIGNLDGVLGLTEQWGIAAGTDLSSSNFAAKWLVASDLGVRLQNVNLNIYSAGVPRITLQGEIDATYNLNPGDVRFGTNTGIPASTTFDFVAATGALRVGAGAGSNRPRLEWTGAGAGVQDPGILRLVNSAGQSTIEFNSSGNAYFSGVVTIGVLGEFRQGTHLVGGNRVPDSGALFSNLAQYTGLRIWNGSNVGQIGGYNAGVLQWEGNPSGYLSAGAGVVTINARGISLQQIVNAQPDAPGVENVARAITWWDDKASDSAPLASIYGGRTGSGKSGFPYIVMQLDEAYLGIFQKATQKHLWMSGIDAAVLPGLFATPNGVSIPHLQISDTGAGTSFYVDTDIIPLREINLGSETNWWGNIYVRSIHAEDTIGGETLTGATWRFDDSDMTIRSNSTSPRKLTVTNDDGVMNLHVKDNITLGGTIDNVDVSTLNSNFNTHLTQPDAHHVRRHDLRSTNDHWIDPDALPEVSFGQILTITSVSPIAFGFATWSLDNFSDFNERAQDAVASSTGGMFRNTATVGYVYNDASNTLQLNVVTGSIDNTLLASVPQNTIKGRVASGSGDPANLTAAQVVSIITTADGDGSGLDADMVDGFHMRAGAQWQIPVTGADDNSGNPLPHKPSWMLLSNFVGEGLSWNTTTFFNVGKGKGIEVGADVVNVLLTSVSGLEFETAAPFGLQVADSIAGLGLDIENKVLKIGGGDGIDVLNNGIKIKLATAPGLGFGSGGELSVKDSLAGKGLVFEILGVEKILHIDVDNTTLNFSPLPNEKVQVNLAHPFVWQGAHTFLATMTTHDLVPETTDSYRIGDWTKWYAQQFVSQINATVFAENTAQLVGGWLIIPKYANKTGAVAGGQTTTAAGQVSTVIDLGVAATQTPQVVATGDFIVVSSHDVNNVVRKEYMKVGTHTGTGNLWNVTRDVTGWFISPNIIPAFPDGTPYMVIGKQGDGRIELNAFDTPRISLLRQANNTSPVNPSPTSFVNVEELVRIGDLFGMPGVSGSPWGIFIGTANEHIKFDQSGVLTIKAKGGGITEINGDNITTGTVSAARIGADSITGKHIKATDYIVIGSGSNDGDANGNLGSAWQTAGIQLDYNPSGSPRAYIGNGQPVANTAARYFMFDGTTISFKAANAILDTTGDLTVTGGTIAGWDITTTHIANAATGWMIRLVGGAAKTARLEAGTGANLAGVLSASADVDIVFWAGAAFSTDQSATTGMKFNADFYVQANGFLKATNVNVTGVVQANTGYFGGSSNPWTITSGQVASTNIKLLASTAVNTARLEVTATAGSAAAGMAAGVAAPGSAKTDVVFWAGSAYNTDQNALRTNAQFYVTAEGDLVARNADIKGVIEATGSITGTVNATGGTIANWSITTTHIANAATGWTIRMVSGTAKTARLEVGSGANLGGVLSASVAADIVFWAGTAFSTDQSATTGMKANADFYVTADGTMKANAGTIAGWSLSYAPGGIAQIHYGTVGMRASPNGVHDIAFWAGAAAASATSAPFRVTHGGHVFMTTMITPSAGAAITFYNGGNGAPTTNIIVRFNRDTSGDAHFNLGGGANTFHITRGDATDDFVFLSNQGAGNVEIYTNSARAAVFQATGEFSVHEKTAGRSTFRVMPNGVIGGGYQLGTTLNQVIATALASQTGNSTIIPANTSVSLKTMYGTMFITCYETAESAIIIFRGLNLPIIVSQSSAQFYTNVLNTDKKTNFGNSNNVMTMQNGDDAQRSYNIVYMGHLGRFI